MQQSSGERLGVAPDGDVLAWFDGLDPVRPEELIGTWRGAGVPTGHRLDGLLERFGWYGKRFAGPDAVHPLLFEDGRGGVTALNPALIPVPLAVRLAPLLRTRPAAVLFRVVRPLLRTRRPRARLRVTEYRGVATATMCYDDRPIHDVFRKVDDDTVIGLMDMRGLDPPFVFVLRRAPGAGQG